MSRPARTMTGWASSWISVQAWGVEVGRGDQDTELVVAQPTGFADARLLALPGQCSVR